MGTAFCRSHASRPLTCDHVNADLERRRQNRRAPRAIRATGVGAAERRLSEQLLLGDVRPGELALGRRRLRLPRRDRTAPIPSVGLLKRTCYASTEISTGCPICTAIGV